MTWARVRNASRQPSVELAVLVDDALGDGVEVVFVGIELVVQDRGRERLGPPPTRLQ